MTAGWVAGTVRAKAMARRVLGPEAARQIAASRSLADAQQLLMPTPFRNAAEPGLSLEAVQHAIAETILWNLRVLAGWLPRDGVSLLRLLAGWFEIANVDELLLALAGRPPGPPFDLGALATAWPRLRQARSVAELRHGLAASAWGDPGGDTIRDIRLGVRISWAARLAASSDLVRSWATTGSAVLQGDQPGTEGPGAGTSAAIERTAPRGQAKQAGRARRSLPGHPLREVSAPTEDAWQAEADWWRGVQAAGRVLLRSSGPDSSPVLGAVVVMTADARRIWAALEIAARGGVLVGAYDAVV